jgi:hypothetical protein
LGILVATRVEVGYTEDEEVYVDLQPASELEGGMEDFQFNELESVAYTEAKLLDKNIAAFVHAIYDYLYGQSEHQSLLYNRYKELLASEKTLKNAEDRKKAYVPRRFFWIFYNFFFLSDGLLTIPIVLIRYDLFFSFYTYIKQLPSDN